MSITVFLLARIAEDEREANVCLDQYRRGEGGSKRRWTRVLAECAAKRAIVEAHRDAGESQGYIDGGYGYIPNCCGTCGTFGEYGEPFPCPTIRPLAAVYDDHPEYLDEWRVEA